MTATAPVSVTPIRLPHRESDTVAHRRLRMQLVPLDAAEYSPERLVAAVTEFCQSRVSAGIECEQVLDECRMVAASRLDIAGVRLVEVLARQSLTCPVPEHAASQRPPLPAAASNQ